MVGGVGSLLGYVAAFSLQLPSMIPSIQHPAMSLSWQSWSWAVGVIAFGGILSLLQLTWMRRGLRQLPGPSPELDNPIRWSVLAYPGLVLILIGIPTIFGTLGLAVSCRPGTLGPGGGMTCTFTGAIWPFFVGVGITASGAVLSVVGWISLALGIWRLDRRYHESLLPIGAVFLVLFPLIGDILLWIGIKHIREGPTVGRPPPL